MNDAANPEEMTDATIEASGLNELAAAAAQNGEAEVECTKEHVRRYSVIFVTCF
jgi:hypothetical protein